MIPIPFDQDIYEYFLLKGLGELAHHYYSNTVFMVPLEVKGISDNEWVVFSTTFDYDSKPVKLNWLQKLKRLWTKKN